MKLSFSSSAALALWLRADFGTSDDIQEYTNNFPTEDNAFGAPLAESGKAEDSFAFVFADYGLFASSTETGECCQTKVADAMRAKRAELEGLGKTLAFVGAGGDNFYWHGLNQADDYTESNICGADQWARWGQVYDGLVDVPWLGAFGNHDWGNSDVYSTCPDLAPRVTIGGQPYASNQLDADKGGYRPEGAPQNFHVPDYNYRYTIDALNLEVFGLDQNYQDGDGIGGDASGHDQVEATCGGHQVLLDRLGAVGRSGERLLNASAAAFGAANASATRNVLAIQHYPDTCRRLADSFLAHAPAGQAVDFRCAFGHVHDSQCEAGTAADCAFAMVGSGGGCCDDPTLPLETGSAGFGLLTFLPGGGMQLEQITIGEPCELWPEGHVVTELDRMMMH